MSWQQTVKGTGTIDDIKITASSDGMVHIAYHSSTDEFGLFKLIVADKLEDEADG